MSIETSKTLDFVEVVIVAHNGDAYDVTENVSEFSLYEEIDSPFIHGEMALIDNSGLIPLLPFIGHELVSIRFKRMGEGMATVSKNFFINGVNNVKQLNEQTAQIMVTLISPIQLTNAQSTFSKKYAGLNTDLVRTLYKEYFEKEVEVLSMGGTSHSIVFPFTKPLDAISLVLQNTYAVDGTPLYLYETLYGNKLELQSWGDMMGADVELEYGYEGTISPIPLGNHATDAKASRNTSNWANRLDTVNMVSGYPLYDGLSSGVYKHDLAAFDLGKKSYNQFIYDYRTNKGMPITNDFVQDSMYNKRLNQKSLFRTQCTNDYAYNTDLPIINSASPLAMSNVKSFRNRRDIVTINGSGPGIEGLRIGKCVNIDIPIRKPSFAQNEKQKDNVNSGKYLISAIRHTYKLGSYTIGVEMIRDGYNPEEKIK